MADVVLEQNRSRLPQSYMFANSIHTGDQHENSGHGKQRNYHDPFANNQHVMKRTEAITTRLVCVLYACEIVIIFE